MSLLPIRYYVYATFWIALGAQTAHFIYKPMKELDEAYRVKRELYRKNSEYLQEIRNKLIKEDQKQ